MLNQNQSAKPLQSIDYPKRRLGVTEDWKIYDLCRRGILPHVKLGRLYKFDEDAVESWIKNGGSPIQEAPQ